MYHGTKHHHNKEAPYTSLRLEVWDNDRLARDQFVGEVTVVEFEDKEGKRQGWKGGKDSKWGITTSWRIRPKRRPPRLA